MGMKSTRSSVATSKRHAGSPGISRGKHRRYYLFLGLSRGRNLLRLKLRGCLFKKIIIKEQNPSP